MTGMPRIDNTNPEETPSRREKLLSKIRRMRSNMSIRSRRGPSERTLRRTKTFGSLSMSSCQAQPMTSLNGRSLEDLARLGGHSFLSLPADFAPTTLRLPACLVATATYLRCNGWCSVFIYIIIYTRLKTCFNHGFFTNLCSTKYTGSIC